MRTAGQRFSDEVALVAILLLLVTTFTIPGTQAQTCSGGRKFCTPTNGGPAVCTDIEGDNANCGDCGRQCPTNFGCMAASCMNGETLSCAVDELQCSWGCVRYKTDYNNCGACGNKCPTGQGCSNGKCVCLGAVCGSQCVDLMTAHDNCGACGKQCPNATDVCKNGTCAAGPVHWWNWQPRPVSLPTVPIGWKPADINGTEDLVFRNAYGGLYCPFSFNPSKCIANATDPGAYRAECIGGPNSVCKDFVLRSKSNTSECLVMAVGKLPNKDTFDHNAVQEPCSNLVESFGQNKKMAKRHGQDAFFYWLLLESSDGSGKRTLMNASPANQSIWCLDGVESSNYTTRLSQCESTNTDPLRTAWSVTIAGAEGGTTTVTSSPTGSPTPSPVACTTDCPTTGPNIAAIVGGVLGGVLALALIGGFGESHFYPLSKWTFRTNSQ